MPLSLPNLDDLTWEQLTEEGRSLIPTWAPEWTNHNASDPGITLMELFAHLSEILIYRLNRVSDANVRSFLRFINGPNWKLQGHLHEAKRQTILELRRPHRAIAAEDFESLTLAVNEELRVECVPRYNPTSGTATALVGDAPGHVTVVVVPKIEGHHAQPSGALLRRVAEALEPARLLTTHVHVVSPRYLTVSIRITLVIRPNADREAVRRKAKEGLERFFDPLEGGSRKSGWPFGRNVYVSEVYQLLAELPDVDYVRRSADPHSKEPMEEVIVGPSEAWRRKLNNLGQLEAIELRPHELVAAWIDEQDIAVTSK